MRIALISPKGPLYRYRGGIFKKNLRYAPLTLVHLAALVPEDLNAEIVIHDEGIGDIPTDLDVDLVAMTVITGSASRAYEISALFRERGIPVVLGGPHVTLVPEDAAPHADCLAVGYAEQTWPQLLRDFAAGKLKKRYNQGADLDISGLPLPRWDLLNTRRFTTHHVYEATRGCVHTCDFCVVPAAWGRKPFQRPIGDVVAEIKARGSKKLIFLDLNIIADRAYAAQLFEALVPLKVKWFGLSTTLLCNDIELLDLAAKSGCRGLLMGLESISGPSLKLSHKSFNDPGGFVEITRMLHARNIALMGTFVFGLDHDDPDIFLRTAELAIEAAIDLPRYAIVTPFPGTELYRRLEAEGRILTRDWDLYDGQHMVFKPARMSVEELQRGHEAAWKATYTVGATWKRLSASRTCLGVTVPANFGYRFYANHLDTHYNCDWFTGTGIRRSA